LQRSLQNGRNLFSEENSVSSRQTGQDTRRILRISKQLIQ
jgi:hypothetical protein